MNREQEAIALLRDCQSNAATGEPAWSDIEDRMQSLFSRASAESAPATERDAARFEEWYRREYPLMSNGRDTSQKNALRRAWEAAAGITKEQTYEECANICMSKLTADTRTWIAGECAAAIQAEEKNRG